MCSADLKVSLSIPSLVRRLFWRYSSLRLCKSSNAPVGIFSSLLLCNKGKIVLLIKSRYSYNTSSPIYAHYNPYQQYINTLYQCDVYHDPAILIYFSCTFVLPPWSGCPSFRSAWLVLLRCLRTKAELRTQTSLLNPLFIQEKCFHGFKISF